MAGVLNGLKVLDLSWGIAGPMTTMLMGDHGAEVVKIEPPGGDRFSGQLGYRVWGRGKTRETIDLKSKEGLAHFLAMADEADVVIESFSPGTVEKLGVDYATLAKRNPRLVYCSISGYGAGNSHSDRPAYDALVAARTGLLWEQRGWPEGAEHHIIRSDGYAPDFVVPYEWTQGPNRPGPVFPSSRWPSLGAFFSASLGLAAALRAREVTGRGQHVETSLFKGAIAAAWAVWQRIPDPDAPNYASWVFGSRGPKGHYVTADGKWVHQWAPNPRFTLESVDSGPRPDLNARFDPDRWGMGYETLLIMANFHETMAEYTGRKDADFWLEAGRIAAMPLQVCRPVEEALSDPLMLADGCVKERVDPELGPIREVGSVVRLSRCDPAKPDEVDPPLPDRTTRPLSRPLEGVRVLDFGLAVAGPYGTQLLSDLGADVIKIGTLNDAYWHSTSTAATCNHGKRSIQIDLKNPRGMEIVRRIAAQSDIVQHNMRYSAAERLGIDYESLKKVKPDLIYCHTRGHERGPRETLAGNDQTGAALAGIQYEDGAVAAGGKPMWALTSFGDTGNGFLSAIGMIHALMHRDRTGQGQFVDTSIVYAAFLNMSYTFGFPGGTGPDRVRLDKDQFGLTALYRIYETAEGWLCVAILTDTEWTAFTRAVGALGDDAAFASAEARTENDKALGERLTAIFKTRTAVEWIKRLDAEGAPAEIVDPEFSVRLFDDPEARKNKWVVGFPHAAWGTSEVTGVLCDLSDTPGAVQGPPLISGANTIELLRDFGYSEDEIASLIAEKAVRAVTDLSAPPPKTGGLR